MFHSSPHNSFVSSYSVPLYIYSIRLIIQFVSSYSVCLLIFSSSHIHFVSSYSVCLLIFSSSHSFRLLIFNSSPIFSVSSDILFLSSYSVRIFIFSSYLYIQFVSSYSVRIFIISSSPHIQFDRFLVFRSYLCMFSSPSPHSVFTNSASMFSFHVLPSCSALLW